MTTDKIIDEILLRLFKDDDYKIDYPILKLQIEADKRININEDEKKAILHTLTAQEICTRTFFNNDSVLELTSHGKKIMNEFGSYTKYLASKKSNVDRELVMKIGQETIDKLMRLAIDSGKKSISEEGKLSPKVGASIFKDGQILGTAFRGQIEPGNHAEFTLFEKILNGADVSDAILFTTLEPCTARGKHTPCSDWIIKKKIKHVFIGLLDPNPKIYNLGCKKLMAAGIEVSYFPKELRKEIMSDNEQFISQYHANPDLNGTASFNYSNNNGIYIIGNNEFIFETKWTKASDKSIHIYNDPPTIKSVAIADGFNEINTIKDGSIYDASSRTRTPQINEVIILENNNGFFAAIKITSIQDKTRPGNNRDELSFEYVILPDKTSDFTKVVADKNCW
jgi:pyrimidine deaminase RibD-like protein